MPMHQYSLKLIQRTVNNSIIEQRADDGYINATAICRVAGKHWHNYTVESTGHFLRALSAKTNISTSVLIQYVPDGKGGHDVWIHPKVAIHFAQWLSGDFAVQVAEWVYEWMNGGATPQSPSVLPAHINRYIANDHKIPTGYFSLLQETTLGLIAPLHNLGFEIPPGWVPDISVGRHFCKWLRTKGVDTDALPTYRHTYQDQRGTVDANLYPDEYLAECRVWFRNVWLPEHGAKSFRKKDPNCMQFYDKLPALAAPSATANNTSL